MDRAARHLGLARIKFGRRPVRTEFIRQDVAQRIAALLVRTDLGFELCVPNAAVQRGLKPGQIPQPINAALPYVTRERPLPDCGRVHWQDVFDGAWVSVRVACAP